MTKLHKHMHSLPNEKSLYSLGDERNQFTDNQHHAFHMIYNNGMEVEFDQELHSHLLKHTNRFLL